MPQEQVAGLETGFETLQGRFNELDDQMASAAQVATRIGDRLQVPAVLAFQTPGWKALSDPPVHLQRS